MRLDRRTTGLVIALIVLFAVVVLVQLGVLK